MARADSGAGGGESPPKFAELFRKKLYYSDLRDAIRNFLCIVKIVLFLIRYNLQINIIEVMMVVLKCYRSAFEVELPFGNPNPIPFGFLSNFNFGLDRIRI